MALIYLTRGFALSFTSTKVFPLGLGVGCWAWVVVGCGVWGVGGGWWVVGGGWWGGWSWVCEITECWTLCARGVPGIPLPSVPGISLPSSWLSVTHLITATDPEGVVEVGGLKDPPRSLGGWYPQPADTELLELHVHRPAIPARLELGAYLVVGGERGEGVR